MEFCSNATNSALIFSVNFPLIPEKLNMSEIQSNMPNQPFLIANVNIGIIFTTYTSCIFKIESYFSIIPEFFSCFIRKKTDEVVRC
ncbi:MAG: hypothetical protein EGP82_05880 [Odoribacter splanchnicus]|nr:hypothetical protein [Odoribacter splanchnicus]